MAGLTLGSRYALEERVGTGGYSEVWRAHDSVLDRPVAIKLLRAEHTSHHETLARFRNEAQLAGRLADENIARVYDFCDGGGAEPPYLVMELIDGPSLADALARGPIGPARALRVIEQVAAGLETAHAFGLVHRDIKPGNIMLTRSGVVKITDFGLSHTLAAAPVTGTGLVIGTPAYLAPERAAGGRATPASDLYALGVIGYECLTGFPPFTGPPLDVATAQVRQRIPALPADVPEPVRALVEDLTAKDPASRPDARTTARRAAGVREWLTGRGGDQPLWPAGAAPPSGPGIDHPTLIAMHTPVEPWTPSPPRPPRGGKAGLVVAGLAAVALAVTIGVAVASPGSAPGHPRHAAGRGAQTVGDFVVNASSFVGEPVQLAKQQLLAAGLLVQVHWVSQDQLPSQDQQPGQQTLQPGQVVSVSPVGARPRGSLVTIVALSPGGDNGHKHDHGNGNGDGGNGGG